MKKSFLWGVSTSAFQLEGSRHADWFMWDPAIGRKPDIVDHYERYKHDLRLLNELGVNSYRFSLEWSRIQPREGEWDVSAIAHYQDIIHILLDNGIEPMLTLHHFTHPSWFTENHPWHKGSSVDKFMEFAEKAVSALKGVRYWITFNEPYVILLGGYMEGCMPPGVQDFSLAVRACKNMLACHAKTYDIIHERHPGSLVSVAHNMTAFTPWTPWNPLDMLLTRGANYFYNHSLIDAFLSGTLRAHVPFFRRFEFDTPIKGKLDFIGINYYMRIHLRFNPLRWRRLGVEIRHRDINGHGLTDLGWEVHPKGLEGAVRYAARLNVPIIVTENGISTKDVHKKISFINSHIEVLKKCVDDGIDLGGYFYWTLIDGYEWLEGHGARFGLYNVDSDTLARKPTLAAAYYSHIAKKHLTKN